jgi:hypothetical protein
MPSIIYKFEEQEHRFPLKDRTTIGRVGDNDLCVPSDSVSSHHAVITRDKSGYFRIEDTGSRNGDVKVIYSPLDLETGWQGMEHPLARAYQPDSAMKLGVNIIMYAMTH